jgi:DnaK suppressor protein
LSAASLADVRAHLEAQLAELNALSDSTKDDRAPVTLDQTSVGRLSRMDALQNQAMAAATQKRRFEATKRIEAALQRIAEDAYGYCVKCGEAIAPARLATDATIPTCIKCAG